MAKFTQSSLHFQQPLISTAIFSISLPLFQLFVVICEAHKQLNSQLLIFAAYHCFNSHVRICSFFEMVQILSWPAKMVKLLLPGQLYHIMHMNIA